LRLDRAKGEIPLSGRVAIIALPRSTRTTIARRPPKTRLGDRPVPRLRRMRLGRARRVHP